MSNYTIYHCHSDFSNGVTNIDSITKYYQYVDRAKECGMTALGFSEHGSVYSWLKKKESIEAAGMKYIHAEEFYLTESVDEKVRDNYHCVLIARNKAGKDELNRLSSEAFRRDTNNFYYVPRLAMDRLFETSDNIIVSTACLASPLSKGVPSVKEKFLTFLINNKDRCFLEIQHHNVPEQIEYNQKLYKISRDFGIPLIAGTDTHALNQEHLKARALLQRAKDVHFEDEDAWDLSFKTYDELVSAYELQNSLPMNVVLEAIENTNRMADMVEAFDVDRSYKYPHIWEDPEKTLREKIEKGIEYRGIKSYPNYQEYLDRIEYEFSVYKYNGAIVFILLMEDIIDFCKKNDIETGWGRGSVNGSIICWLLQITQMDSIKFNLNFERFMNTERVSLADIDTDFPPSRRDEVKEYIVNHHGLFCSDIITFNTIATKGAVRDVCRGLYKNSDKDYLETANYICNNVDVSEKKMRSEFPDVFSYVDLVSGTIVSTGSHPCGMITSATPLEGDIGLCTNSNDPYPISQIYMKEIDSLNYVKLDLLALDTIEIIANTCKLAGIPMVNPDTLDVNDDAVWRSMRDDTTSCFQWEGATGDEYIKRLMSDKNIEKLKKENPKMDRMMLLTIGNSAIRPAGASYRDELANGVVRKTSSPAINEFLKDTFGMLVFQEQIIFFLNKFCGFTMGEADVVRRGFAKKTGTEQFIPRIKDGFIKTSVEKYGRTREEAEEDIVAFLQVINDASSYLFSLNHSEPYSYEGYAEAWLRYYYPTEFITTALNNCVGKEEKTTALSTYAKKVGVKIVSPQFRHSRAEYFCDPGNKVIYKGIGSIKYLNNQVAEELYELRENRYDSFTDLLYDMSEKTTIDSRQLDILIKLDFFREFGDINKLEYVNIRFGELATKKVITKDKLESLVMTDEIIAPFAGKITPTRIEEIDVVSWSEKMGISRDELEDCKKPSGEYSTRKTMKKFGLGQTPDLLPFATKIVIGRYADIDNRGLIRHLEETCKPNPISLENLIRYQREHLGYISYTDEKLDPRLVVVTELDTKYSPRFKAYCLKNGQTCEMRIHAKKNPRERYITSWSECPLHEGDIVYMSKCTKRPRQKKDGDKWVVVQGEYVWWLDSYKLDNIIHK